MMALVLWGCDNEAPEGATEAATSSSTSGPERESTTGTSPAATSSTSDTPQGSSTTGPAQTTSGSETTGTDSGSGDATTTATTTDDTCSNGMADGDEADVDCGGPCEPCPTGSACVGPLDCDSEVCETGSCLGPAVGCDPDGVQGQPGGLGWADSYSVDGRCFCASSFDHNIGGIMVDTPAGPRTVLEVCEAIGPGPGIGDNPIYNDIQCGNGPANDAGDEDWCPGRVDLGQEGCCTAGPTWDLSGFKR